MKEVKIYTIVSDQLSPPITGESFCTDMVRHSDYAELEAKSAALAADNDKAMESLNQADAVVKLAHEKFSALAAENAGLKHAMAVTLEHVSVTDAGQAGVAAMIINDALHHSEPPATDAFLAEVRAQGVEMFGSVTIKFGEEEGDEDIVYAGNQALLFAAQLRKGAAL
ncbi:hypothetical protein AHR24_24210 [Salmonella enterica subsp. diarizonae]|nr:hypothetical protein [Salmonella enterica subsp. diarizonae]